MSEKTVWTIGRVILSAVVVLFVLFGFIFKQPCDIDKIYLSCRLTGTIADWIGSIGFLASVVWLSGIMKGFAHLQSPPGSTSGNLIAFAVAAISVLLFWNL